MPSSLPCPEAMQTADLGNMASSPWVHRHQCQPQQDGALSGSSFAVKAMISVAGEVPSLGNPCWDAGQVKADRHAACVLQLLDAGAELLGATVMDELALGVTGTNPHTGTPANPRAPGRVPGGSSSGSAVVVASGQADFALGTDCGGSIRVPASWCGVYGWRPTHGLISTEGVPVSSPSLDVVGVLANSLTSLAKVCEVYSCQPATQSASTVTSHTGTWRNNNNKGNNNSNAQLMRVRDLWDLCDPTVRSILAAELNRYSQEPVQEITLAELFAPLPMTAALLTQTFLHIGMYEVSSSSVGAWASAHPESLSDALREQLEAFSQVTQSQYAEAMAVRGHMQSILDAYLLGRVLVFPTTPGPAPLRQAVSGSPADAGNSSIQTLCALSSISGCPQVSLPLMKGSATESATTTTPPPPPCGLSLLGKAGEDLQLLHLARHISDKC